MSKRTRSTYLSANARITQDLHVLLLDVDCNTTTAKEHFNIKLLSTILMTK